MLLNQPRTSAVMRERGFDALLASTLQNVFYLSHFWNENFLITPRSAQTCAMVVRDELDSPSVIASVGDAAAVLVACPPQTKATFFGSAYRYGAPDIQLDALEQDVINHLASPETKPNILEALVTALTERSLTRGVVGYDDRGLSERLVEELRGRLPQVEFRPADSAFLFIRAVKTEEELQRIQAALALTEEAVRAAMAFAQPGVTEDDMIREFDKTIAGGGGRPLFTQISIGRRGALGQQPFPAGVLRRGDIIRFDVGCVLMGYCSDIARNFAIGEPGERMRRLHAITLAAQNGALAILRPGAKASEVFHAGVEAARAAGLPDYRRHHVGHAVGLEVYEMPLLGPNDNTTIEEGMTFEIETPYYEVGTAGIQPEDTVVVTSSGPRILTTLPRELVVLE